MREGPLIFRANKNGIAGGSARPVPYVLGFTELYLRQFGDAPYEGCQLLGNVERRRGYRPLVLCRKAPGISRNLFPKSVDYVDCRRAGHESCTNLEHCIDLFANDKMRFVLRINAAACKLRDAESYYLARFHR